MDHRAYSVGHPMHHSGSQAGLISGQVFEIKVLFIFLNAGHDCDNEILFFLSTFNLTGKKQNMLHF